MKHDRFLQAILAAIGLLAAAALAIYFIHQNSQAYGAEDTPEGVVRNYVLALQQQDYDRAYTYTAEQRDRPDFENFRLDILSLDNEILNTGLQIGEVRLLDDQAIIELNIIRRDSRFLGDMQREAQQALLIRDQSGAWKIMEMPYPFGYGTALQQTGDAAADEPDL